MLRSEIRNWLPEKDPQKLSWLWQHANQLRRETVGGKIHLRALLEFSNCCRRDCAYCGLRAANRKVTRYRMSAEKILTLAEQAARRGFGTVVLQSGEDPKLDPDWLAELIRKIKSRTALAVTLSVGERAPAELALWRQAGADRYLLRFESANPDLFRRHHPARPGHSCDRLALLGILRDLGYEIGSGMLIGLPGQTMEDLVADLYLLGKLDLDMIGLGPFIPHPDTPLGRQAGSSSSEQVPANEDMTYRAIALARLICPRANIPATTALTTLSPQHGLELGLGRGANVFMPSITPAAYRDRYQIYPGRAQLCGSDNESFRRIAYRIRAMGREIGQGRGDAINYLARKKRKSGGLS